MRLIIVIILPSINGRLVASRKNSLVHWLPWLLETKRPAFIHAPQTPSLWFHQLAAFAATIVVRSGGGHLITSHQPTIIASRSLYLRHWWALKIRQGAKPSCSESSDLPRAQRCRPLGSILMSAVIATDSDAAVHRFCRRIDFCVAFLPAVVGVCVLWQMHTIFAWSSLQHHWLVAYSSTDREEVRSAECVVRTSAASSALEVFGRLPNQYLCHMISQVDEHQNWRRNSNIIIFIYDSYHLPSISLA